MLRMFGGIHQRKYSCCGKGTANKGGGGRGKEGCSGDWGSRAEGIKQSPKVELI